MVEKQHTSNRIASQKNAALRRPRWREVHEKFTRLFLFPPSPQFYRKSTSFERTPKSRNSPPKQDRRQPSSQEDKNTDPLSTQETEAENPTKRPEKRALLVVAFLGSEK
jgi:hypothetical protein